MKTIIHIVRLGCRTFARTLLDLDSIHKDIQYKVIVVSGGAGHLEDILKKYDVIARVKKWKNLDSILDKYKPDCVLFTSHVGKKILRIVTKKYFSKICYAHHGISSRWMFKQIDRVKSWAHCKLIGMDQLYYDVFKSLGRDVKKINGLAQIDWSLKINKQASTRANTLLITTQKPSSQKKYKSTHILVECVVDFYKDKYENILITHKQGFEMGKLNLPKDVNVQFVASSCSSKDSPYHYFNAEAIVHINYGSLFVESLLSNRNVLLIDEECYPLFKEHPNLKVVPSVKYLNEIDLKEPIPQESINDYLEDILGSSEIVNFTEKFCEYVISET